MQSAIAAQGASTADIIAIIIIKPLDNISKFDILIYGMGCSSRW
jgi:hypothetical protein